MTELDNPTDDIPAGGGHRQWCPTSIERAAALVCEASARLAQAPQSDVIAGVAGGGGGARTSRHG